MIQHFFCTPYILLTTPLQNLSKYSIRSLFLFSPLPFFYRLNTAIPVIFSPVQSAAPGGYSAAAPAAGGYDGPAGGAAPLGDYEQPADAASALEQARSSFRSGRTRSGFSRQGRRNSLRSFGRNTGRRNNGRGGRRNNSRRGNNSGRQNQRNRGGRARSFSRRGRQEVTVPAPDAGGPETLYGAPAPPAETGLAEYGAATAPLPSYGQAPASYGVASDDLPSYGIGNRRSSASNVVPVYVPRSGRAQYYYY